MAMAEAKTAGNRLRELGLDREDAVQMYRNMLVTRGVEERGHILFRQGKIPGSFYTGRGNEAASVGSAWAMKTDDWGTPLHRDMGVHITRGVEPWRIFAQYMAREGGPTRGKDGNVHLADAKLGLIAMVSHLPAMLPVATGCALAFWIRGDKDRCAFAWSGDGATARGDFHEGVNLGAVRKLPIVYIIDNNQWAYSTPRHLGFATKNVADRAKGYGIPGVVVDGTDILEVYDAIKTARERAVSGKGPTVVELVTLRMEGHAVHDDAFYVPKEDFETWAQKDPIERFRSFLLEHTDFTEDQDEELRTSVKRYLTEQLEKAEASPEPDPQTALQGVWASPEELDNPHH
jgi:TPP-dependent pyruvate/acetoin dehydrogenase alpha subunit